MKHYLKTLAPALRYVYSIAFTVAGALFYVYAIAFTIAGIYFAAQQIFGG